MRREPRDVSRRNFLDRMVRLSATGATATFIVGASSRTLEAATQDNWRLCSKCSAQFFNGYPQKGRCPAGGGHAAQGFNFVLPYDVPESPQAQGAWRFCNKCNELFFGADPQTGACPTGGGHVAQGFNFVLPHDVPESRVAQPGWRFCCKCNAMYFDGNRSKGRCPVGGGHLAQGFNFVLRYREI